MNRSEQPKVFRDLSLAPVEQALLHRAEASMETAVALNKAAAEHGAEQATVREAVALGIAEAFRKLAEELHHW